MQTLTLIVATEARANYLGLPSEDAFKNRGVSACAVCDGALPRFRNQPLAVLGGGDSAVEEASYLAKYASVVYLVHRRDELRASKIMRHRAWPTRRSKSSGVTSCRRSWALTRTASRVCASRAPKTARRDLQCSGVFLAIGHTPNTGFLRDKLELTEKGYIKWQQPFRTLTSVEGVFAAGDVADDYYRQAITSAGTGCMAALDAEPLSGRVGVVTDLCRREDGAWPRDRGNSIPFTYGYRCNYGRHQCLAGALSRTIPGIACVSTAGCGPAVTRKPDSVSWKSTTDRAWPTCR